MTEFERSPEPGQPAVEAGLLDNPGTYSFPAASGTIGTLASVNAAIEALDPILIPGLITPVQTPGAVGGVNFNMLHASVDGLLVFVRSYENMAAGDAIALHWGDDNTPVASGRMAPEDVGQFLALHVPEQRAPAGLLPMYFKVTRAGSGNVETSASLNLLSRYKFPGGTDPDPEAPGHQGLKPPVPATDKVGPPQADAGVVVQIPAYANMRQFDRVRLSWGGELVDHAVSQAEVGQPVSIRVDGATIRKAGDSPQVVLVYRVMDEVQNQSSEWSERSYVDVELGAGKLEAPIIENPDEAADPYDVIDPEKLQADTLRIYVQDSPTNDLKAGATVELTWVGTTAQGQAITLTLTQVLENDGYTLTFHIPREQILKLGRGRAKVSYKASNPDGSTLESRNAYVTFLGEEQRLAKPTVEQAVGGQLDAGVETPVVIVPGADLQRNDRVEVTWQGVGANGKPVFYQYSRTVSANNAGKDMRVAVNGAQYLLPLDGQVLTVSYTITRAGMEKPLESEKEVLLVGVVQDLLPAPTTRPAPVDGVFDPATLPEGVEVIIEPYPGMAAGQTVALDWRASVGAGFSDRLTLSAADVGQPVRFKVPAAQLQQNLNGGVSIGYRVEQAGQSPRSSARLEVQIRAGTGETELPDPVVVGAGPDGSLDPANGATTLIAWRAFFKPGDQFTVIWDDGAGRRTERTVTAGSEQVPEVRLSKDELAPSLGRTINVFYRYTPVSGAIRYSKVIRITLQSGVPVLPAPWVDGAPNGVLDPKFALDNGGARARGQYTGYVPGDLAYLIWEGPTAQGSYESRPGDANPGVMTELLPNSVLAYCVGKTVQVSYGVIRNGVTYYSEKLTLQVSALSYTHMPQPQVLQAAGGVLDLNTFTGDATVTVAPWPLIAAGQRVWLTADAPSGSYSLLTAHVVTAAEVTAGLRVNLPRREMQKVADGSNFAINGFVTLDRSTTPPGTAFRRLDLTLVRQTIGDLKPPRTVPSPVNGVIELPGDLSTLTVVVDPYPGMAVGDSVKLYVEADGASIHAEVKEINALGQVTFAIDRALLLQHQSKTWRLYYSARHNPGSGAGVKSPALSFRISIPVIKPLDPPFTIPEPVNGELVVQALNIMVPSYSGMVPGHTLYIKASSNGVELASWKLTVDSAGGVNHVSVSRDMVALWAGKQVDIQYSVKNPGSSTVRYSPFYTFRVKAESQIVLPDPFTAPLSDKNGDLALSGITTDLRVWVPNYLGSAIGQVVTTSVWLDGGPWKTFQTTIKAGLFPPFNYAIARSELVALVGRSFTVRYTVAVPGGETYKSQLIRFRLVAGSVVPDPGAKHEDFESYAPGSPIARGKFFTVQYADYDVDGPSRILSSPPAGSSGFSGKCLAIVTYAQFTLDTPAQWVSMDVYTTERARHDAYPSLVPGSVVITNSNQQHVVPTNQSRRLTITAPAGGVISSFSVSTNSGVHASNPGTTYIDNLRRD